MTARAAVALAAVVWLSACGAPLAKLKLPAGPGVPAPDASGALAGVLDRCRAVRALAAEVVVSGSSRGRRLRARLTAAVAVPASARLEAVAAFGQPLFMFVTADNDATLWIPRDQRVLEHTRPDIVLDAVAGVPLDGADLRATLTGCASENPDPAGARAYGETWRVVPVGGGGELYLNREGATAPWRLVAVVGGAGGRAWRAEYRDFQQDLPRVIRVTSVGSAAFDLQLALSQVNVNPPLAPEVFLINVPASAERITVDELRRSGPLARQTGASDGR